MTERELEQTGRVPVNQGPANRGWRRQWRWAVPGAVAALIVGGVGIAGVAAGADAPLPPKSAEELLTMVQNAQVDGLSGTVVQTSNLGLPDLGAIGGGGGGSAELSTSLTGTHTWRVWYGGQDKARLALIGGSGETDIIRNGNDVWTWSSADSSATHTTLPARSDAEKAHPELTDPSATASPQEVSSELLKAIDPTTQVTTDGTGTVAGRQVYELVLIPKTEDTLVKQVRIAVDAQQGIPLRVQVLSTKVSDPAFEVGFTSVDFAVPQDRQFQFTAPSGTKVTEQDSSSMFGSHEPGTEAGKTPGSAPAPAEGTANSSKVVGEGWSAVFVGTLSAQELSSLQQPGTASTPDEGSQHGEQGPQDVSGLVNSLPQVSGAWGSGRVLEGTLFTAILTDDGRYAVGAVPVATLEAALATR